MKKVKKRGNNAVTLKSSHQQQAKKKLQKPNTSIGLIETIRQDLPPPSPNNPEIPIEPKKGFVLKSEFGLLHYLYVIVEIINKGIIEIPIVYFRWIFGCFILYRLFKYLNK